jgi:hypothetical protein
MIGQIDVGAFAPVLAWIVAVGVAFGPGALAVTKLVDGVRSFDTTDSWPPVVWIVLAFAIAIVACVAFEINVVGGLWSQLPAAAGSSALNGIVGQALTGAGIAGTASWHHERMDRTSSQAAAARG